jgi:hypothetical protein
MTGHIYRCYWIGVAVGILLGVLITFLIMTDNDAHEPHLPSVKMGGMHQ